MDNSLNREEAAPVIGPVTPEQMMAAAAIHAESWQDSHRAVCSPEFLALHTPQRQKACLEAAIAAGARLYMLTDGRPVGIVSVRGSCIENLYILPAEQNKGYGSRLLEFAIGQCAGAPTLWVLNTNPGARRLYERRGFRPTGQLVQHGGGLYEQEFRLDKI